jgi:hypothetical protein
LGFKIGGDGLSVVWPQNHWDCLLRFGFKIGGDGFSSIWVSKLMATVFEWFGLKTTQSVFTGLASKPVVTVFGGWAPKPAATVSDSLASKPAMTVSDGLASKPAATVSPGLASKPVVVFLVEPQNQGGGGFPGLGLKTGSYGLVIWASKSPRQFLSLGFKTKQALVCRLCHKTDGGRSAWDTC